MQQRFCVRSTAPSTLEFSLPAMGEETPIDLANHPLAQVRHLDPITAVHVYRGKLYVGFTPECGVQQVMSVIRRALLRTGDDYVFECGRDFEYLDPPQPQQTPPPAPS